MNRQGDLDWGVWDWDPAKHPRDRRGRFTKSRTADLTMEEKARGNAVVDNFRPKTFASDAEANAYLSRDPDPPLTEEQIAAIDYYTGDAFLRVNQELRSTGESDEYPVVEMREAMRPTPDDLILTRTVGMEAFGEVPLNELAGKKVKDAAFSSTALGMAFGSKLNKVTMKIAVPKGTPAVFAAPHSRNPTEREIILGDGLEFAVASVKQNDDFGYDMTLVVLPSTAAARLRMLRPRNAADPPDLDPSDLPDVSHLQESWEQALEVLLEDWAGIEDGQKAQLVEGVLAVARDGALADLADLSVDSAAGAERLLEAMLEIAAEAAEQLVEEAAAQGVQVAPVPPDETMLAEVSIVVAATRAAVLASGAALAAMRANGPDVEPEEVAEAVEQHLGSLSIEGPRPLLGGALTGAQNAGRFATLRAAPEGALYSSEKNDRNTCVPCHEVNGRWLGNISDMDRVSASYPGGAYGGYVLCQGRERCRGTIVGVWRK